jgi:DNA-binding CsgD family transcriptional regulator
VTVENSAAVIGRDAELEIVTHFLDATASGPAALMMRGEAGIGKTTIWQAATALARQASYTVLSSRPGPAESDLPYVGLGDLLAHVPGDVVSRLAAPQRRALDVALLRVDAGSSPLEQRAVSSAALNVVVELARSAPVLVAIDDLQWLDPPSVRVLRFAVRRMSSARIGILVASRSGGPDDDPLRLADAFPPERLDRLIVGPLELSAVDRLLRCQLHTSFLAPTLRRLHDTSAGNPFFAIELGRALLDPDTYAVPGQPFPAPSSLPQLLGARLDRIPPPARQALLAASALARPTVDLVLAATASDGVTPAHLDQAVDAGVVTVHGGGVRFTHPLLASVLYAEASGEERRRLHRRLAGLVADPEEGARHLGLSADGPDADIAAALENAARLAASRGAPDAAARLLQQAAELTHANALSDVTRFNLDAADQHFAAGDTAQARLLLERVSSMSGAGVTRARALHRLGRLSVLDGDVVAAPPLLQAALHEVGDDLALRASIERDLVFALAQVGPISQVVPRARAALEAAEASGQPILIAEAMEYLCMAEALTGDEIDPELLDRAVVLDQQVGMAPQLKHPGIATGRFPLALTLKLTDDFEPARQLLKSLQAEHLDHGDEGALAPVLFHLGELECWAGNWTVAAGLAQATHDLASRTGQAAAERRALAIDAMVASYRGDAQTVHSTATASLALAEQAGDSLSVIRSLKSLGVLALSIGDAEDASRHLERAIALEAGMGHDPAVVRVVPDAIEAFLAVGRLSDAALLVEDLETRAARSGRVWARATGARCRGLLEAASGRLADAQHALETAVHAHERLSQPFERARTLLALGSVQRRAKQKRAARDSLEEALRVFDGLGATLWAAKTRAELGRIAGRTTSRVALTETENQVARLVAEGQTNREVALTLFMSVKTVEVNLTRIYRKVGVTSRRELAGLIQQGERG